MALTQILSGLSTTGSSSAFKVAALKNSDGNWSDAGTHIMVHLTGVRSGTVNVQIAPTATGPWVTPADGSVTEDSVVVTPVSNNAYVRVELESLGGGSPETELVAWAG